MSHFLLIQSLWPHFKSGSIFFKKLSKKKTKENELEKKRLLEEQFRLKKQLAQLTLDFKSEYLQKCGDNCVDQANGKFKSILQSLNIDAHPNDQVNNFQIDFDQKQNSYSNSNQFLFFLSINWK